MQNVIDPALCGWDTAYLLIFSDNVFGNYIYYSHLFPALSGLLLGIFVLWQKPRALLNQTLFFVFLVFSVWNFFDLILWATEKTHYTIFFWSVMIFLDALIYAGSWYFIHLFIDKKDISFSKKLIVASLFIPLFLLAHTSFNLIGFDFTNCDREALEGPLWHYTYAFEFFLALWIAFFGNTRYREARDPVHRRQILAVTLGTLLFLLTFSWGNIIGSLQIDWELGQYGILGAPLFIAFLTYLMVRYQAFNAKLFAAQVLVVALAIGEISILFVRKIENVRVITIVTFILIVVLGALLVRSVRREVEQRERIERLAADLRQANVRLRELDKLKTEFVSIASHQLRSPLAAIKGYASMLLEGSFGKLSVGAHEAVGRILTSSALMVRSVEDFLNVSRIELGKMRYDLSQFDLCNLIEIAVDEQKPFAEEKKLALEFKKDKDVRTCDIFADMGKLKQVFTNLIDNAIKYTPRGTITVTFSRDLERAVARIEVADTGVGMTAETIRKLFGKFARADNANKVNVIGTGLGLYVVRQLVEAHGGRVWAESLGEGKGSTFIVELPLTAQGIAGKQDLPSETSKSA